MFPAIKEFLIEFFARVLRRKREEPPLEITAKQARVKNIWGWSNDFRRQSFLFSLIVHGVVIALLIVVFREPVKKIFPKIDSTISFMEIPLYHIQPKPPSDKGGGGGGGDRSPLPASKGKLPRAASKQFTPPTAVVQNPNPKLIMEPTIVIQPDASIPNVNMPQLGDPFGKIGPPSSGPGSGGGIGSGKGGGVGPGTGPGVGPGPGGGFGGGVYHIGEKGASAPQLIYGPEPEYSDEARKAKFQGTVLLSAEVNEKGEAQNIKVMRPLGLGLDEKAIEAIEKWRFKPGLKDGKPITVSVTIEVNFRLL